MNQQFICLDEIAGFEFDWYAVDLSGQYALFSTAGSGMIPECIQSYIDEYSDISIPNNTTGKQPWKPLAEAGFFVFDMVGSDIYHKKINPTAPLKPYLLKQFQTLPNLLQFNGYFEQTAKIIDLSNFSLKGKEIINHSINKI